MSFELLILALIGLLHVVNIRGPMRGIKKTDSRAALKFGELSDTLS